MPTDDPLFILRTTPRRVLRGCSANGRGGVDFGVNRSGQRYGSYEIMRLVGAYPAAQRGPDIQRRGALVWELRCHTCGHTFWLRASALPRLHTAQAQYCDGTVPAATWPCPCMPRNPDKPYAAWHIGYRPPAGTPHVLSLRGYPMMRPILRLTRARAAGYRAHPLRGKKL